MIEDLCTLMPRKDEFMEVLHETGAMRHSPIAWQSVSQSTRSTDIG